MAFWRRRKNTQEETRVATESFIEVVDYKRQTHESADQAKKDIDKLNKLLRANGITLKIHIATKGQH